VKGYLVDTNVPSELTRETPDARVAAFLRRAEKESLFLSVMTLGEICKGIDLLPASQKRDALRDCSRLMSVPGMRAGFSRSPSPSQSVGGIWPRAQDNRASR